MKIGIIGLGFVGKATNLLKSEGLEVLAYDILPELCNPKDLKLEDLKDCELIFISVPTPMREDGSCYLKIVESVVKDLEKINFQHFVVLRSTVPVGTSDRLNLYFMPEFLTEKNYEQDFINNKEWIFGLKGDERDETFKKRIEKLFNLAFENKRIKYNNLSFVSNSEAEMIKMFRNCFLATKIGFCNEIYQFCNKKNINYENVRKIACNDDRILHSHSFVPGHDGKLGFGGTCFPKDVKSMINQIDQVNSDYPILFAVAKRNEEIDRPDKDWESNNGRAVI